MSGSNFGNATCSTSLTVNNYTTSTTPKLSKQHSSLTGLLMQCPSMDLTGQKRKRVSPAPNASDTMLSLTVSQSTPLLVMAGTKASSGGGKNNVNNNKSMSVLSFVAGDVGSSSSSSKNNSFSSTSSSSSSSCNTTSKILSSLVDQPAVKVPALSPAQYLKQAFREWDIPIESTREQSCFLQVTPERIQAYDRDLLGLVRNQDLKGLQVRLEQGKLLNACNNFGESLLHLACRKGLTQVVEFLVCTARLSCLVHDDYGRTIWHDACWTVRPEWALVEFLLEQAPFLLTMSDVRGHIPVDYVPKSDWAVWVSFLEQHRDRLKEQLLLNKKSKSSTNKTMEDGQGNSNNAGTSLTSAAVRATIDAQKSMQHRLKEQQEMSIGTMSIIHENQEEVTRDCSDPGGVVEPMDIAATSTVETTTKAITDSKNIVG
ncbi:ankyrin repeat domain protein [Nitzschia inconspicua]|uniref:Ankyrin repeat domain protein n=1 Tax=Nitzschia inconspicua TaxID=303405 RepID=A0A9K3PAU9_9STRA|nr:ankyrin repeat domain protein [Nitzschia inconspicua]